MLKAVTKKMQFILGITRGVSESEDSIEDGKQLDETDTSKCIIEDGIIENGDCN